MNDLLLLILNNPAIAKGAMALFALVIVAQWFVISFIWTKWDSLRKELMDVLERYSQSNQDTSSGLHDLMDTIKELVKSITPKK